LFILTILLLDVQQIEANFFFLNLSSSWKCCYLLLMMDDTVTKKDTANGSVNKHVDVASLNCKKVEDHVAFFFCLQ